jgi:hypothetical protein
VLTSALRIGIFNYHLSEDSVKIKNHQNAGNSIKAKINIGCSKIILEVGNILNSKVNL